MAEVVDIIRPEDLDASAIVVAAGTAAALFTTTAAPTAVGTSAISKWMGVLVEGVYYYIPMWT